jgi:integrase
LTKCKKIPPQAGRRSRRANHTGSVWCQNGLWYGKLAFKGQLLRTASAHTRAKAESALNKLAASIARQKACKTTLAEWAAEWLAAISHKSAYNTYRNYQRAVDHVCRHIGTMRLTEITPHDMTQTYTRLIEEGQRSTTVLLAASVMTALARYAVRCKKLDFDFTAGAIKPTREKRTYRVFTPQEAVTFVKLLEHERLKFPLLFMLLLGVRRGEAMAIKWDKIDLDSRTVIIDTQAITESGARVLKTTKTESSTRTLPIPDLLLQKLQEVPKHKRKSYPYEFAKLYPDALSRDFKRIATLMRIDNMRLHDLRHTFASTHAYRGVPAKEVADLLGHANDKIVNNVYVHRAPHHASASLAVSNEIFAELLSENTGATTK